MSNERKPAEIFPVGTYIAEELEARGWSTADSTRAAALAAMEGKR